MAPGPSTSLAPDTQLSAGAVRTDASEPRWRSWGRSVSGLLVVILLGGLGIANIFTHARWHELEDGVLWGNRAEGVTAVEIASGSAGARAGIQQGDVILRVGGRDVNPDQTVSYIVANTPVGSKIPVDLIRGGKRQTVTVTVGQRPTEEELAKQLGGGDGDDATQDNTPTTPGSTTIGLQLQPISPSLARALNLPATARGVVITQVDPNSDASEKGLQRGDLILSVNQAQVTSPAQVTAAVDAARRAGRTSVLLLVKRGTGPEAFVGVDIAPQQ